MADTNTTKIVVKALTEGFDKVTKDINGLSTQMNQLGTNLSGQSKAFKEVAEAAEKSSSSISTWFSRTSSNLASKLIVKAIQAVTNTLKESAKAAASAEQVYQKLSTVYAGLGSSASSAATEIANASGVATSTAASAISQVGDMLQAQGMSTAQSLEIASQWVQQFQDIIAFKDIDMSLEEFASSFMSGTAGNTKNFRQFGSIVKETAVQAELAARGLNNLTGTELELAKMTIRADLALEQQANAMGATQNEWNTTLSITRRFNEANKELKENIGESINETLNPLKIAWTNIATQINKAKKAQDEYNKGSRNISVYDIDTDESDYSIFKQAVHSAQNKIQKVYHGIYSSNPAEVTKEAWVSGFKEILVEFDASVDDIKDAWSWLLYSTDMPDWLYNALKEYENEGLLQERQSEQAQNYIDTTWTKLVENSSDIIESLSSISGINPGNLSTKPQQMAYAEVSKLQNTGTFGTVDDLEQGEMRLSLNMPTVIDGLLQQFYDAPWEDYLDPLALALGQVGVTEGLEAKIDKASELYSTLSNYYATNSDLSEEQEAAILAGIKNYYEQLKAQVENIEDVDGVLEDLAKSNAKFLEGTSELQAEVDTATMDDREKAMYDLDASYRAEISAIEAARDAINASVLTDEEKVAKLNELKIAEDDLNTSYEKQVALTNNLYDKEEQIAALKNVEKDVTSVGKDVTSFISKGDSNKAAVAQWGMTDLEKEKDNIKAAYQIQLDAIDAVKTSEDYLKLSAEDRLAMDSELALAAETLTSSYNDQIATSEELNRLNQEKAAAEKAAEQKENFKDSVTGTLTSSMGEAGNLISTAATNIEEMGVKAGLVATAIEYVIKFLDEDTLTALENSLNPILQMLKSVAHALSPLIKMMIEIIQPVLEYTAAVFIWVSGNIRHAIAGVVNWLASWISWVDPVTDDGAVSWNQALAQAKSDEGLSDGKDSQTKSSIAGANYSGQTTIYLTINQNAPVVGENGMQQFAVMVRSELQSLDMYGY